MNGARTLNELINARLVSRGVGQIGQKQQRSPFGHQAIKGRLVSLQPGRPSAQLTAAMWLVRQAQQDGELVGWVAGTQTLFFPPDVQDAGVDLNGLVVVRPGDGTGALKAVELLTRSGGFGLVVLDLVDSGKRLDNEHQAHRLAALARVGEVGVVALWPVEGARTSSAISMVARASLEQSASGAFQMVVEGVADRCRPNGWRVVEACREPIGLC